MSVCVCVCFVLFLFFFLEGLGNTPFILISYILLYMIMVIAVFASNTSIIIYIQPYEDLKNVVGLFLP